MFVIATKKNPDFIFKHLPMDFFIKSRHNTTIN
jgi:hypothetical protein